MYSMINGTVNTTVKVFDQPSSASTQVATLYKGNTITASSNTGTWLRLLTRNGVYISGYANSRVGEGMTNGDITWKNDAVVPPPPPPPTGRVLKNIIDVYNDGSIVVKPQ
jgi:hypothetical protein